MRLRITELAANDLENIYDFIARDNLDAAIETVDGLLSYMAQLLKNPRLGRATDGESRRLVHHPFVIVYRIVEDVINIEAVFHGSRNYNKTGD